MTCSYCGTRNNEGEHRCRRCGRKPDDTLNGEISLPHNFGALATQPVFEPTGMEPSESQKKGPPNLARAVQRPLFQDKQATKVVPIGPPPAREAAPRPAQRSARRSPRALECQGTLDFLPPATSKPRTLGTAVEAVIFCEERVATVPHRAFAAILDWSMVLIAYGVFLGVFLLCVGGLPLDKTNLIVMASVLPLFGVVYGLVWVLVGAETAGMQWTQLRLTTFEGFRPERRERLLRFAGSCLSLCTIIGLLWSLADEEGLAWQDHISRTFPTPRCADSQVFLRR